MWCKLQLSVINALMALKPTKLPCCIDFIHDCVYILQDARLERVKKSCCPHRNSAMLSSIFFNNYSVAR